MNNNIPSINPADNNFTGMFKHINKKLLQSTDDMLPAKIISYDQSTNLATVQPMIQMVSTGGQFFDRATIAHVPVMRYGGGGYIVHAPIKAGNLGWIKANDRDISLFMQGFTKAHPNTYRIKSFSDSVFIPDVMTGYTISDNDSLYIQNMDGSAKITLNDSFISLKIGIIELKVSSAGIAITGGTVTHDGVNIGKTHIHTDPQGGNTGAPH